MKWLTPCFVFAVVSMQIAGCAGMPVGWGGTHAIDHTSRDMIIISYDELTESYFDIREIAENHCQTSGRNANPSKIHKDRASSGLVKTVTFDCTYSEPGSFSDAETKQFNHREGLGYQEKKVLTLYSVPSGAKVMHSFNQDAITNTNSCVTPCSLEFQSHMFSGKPETDYYLIAEWNSGYRHIVKLEVLSGTNEHFTFHRNKSSGYEDDLRYEQRLYGSATTNPGNVANAKREISSNSQIFESIAIGVIGGLIGSYLSYNNTKAMYYEKNLENKSAPENFHYGGGTTSTNHYLTRDAFGNVVSSGKVYKTRDKFGNIVSSDSEFLTLNYFGNTVRNTHQFQAKDAFGNIVTHYPK